MQIVTASLKYLLSIIIVLTIAHSDINTELQKALKNKTVGIPLLHKKQTIKFSDINQGTLVRNIDETDQYEILPNLKTNVNIQIDGMVTTTTVDQVFTNDSDEPMEAIYVFPLPLDAAVNDMKMIINDRFIQGIIKEKEEAGWLIIYLGADHDAFTQSNSLNFDRERSMRYSKEDSIDTFRAVTRTTIDYRKGQNNKNIRFTEEERSLSDKKRFKEDE